MRAVGYRECSRHRLLPRFIVSKSVSPRSSAHPPPPSLVARRIPYPSFLFISLYGLISSFPRRARYIYRFVSPSGSCLYHTATSASPLAVRPPKLSRRHDLCFLRPSGGLIPFCCRMYMYVCAAASPVPFSVLSLRRCLPRAARARESTHLPHTTDYSRSSRSRRPPCPRVPSLRGFFRDFFSAVPSSPFPPFSSFDGAL